jgi:hypothetical protein
MVIGSCPPCGRVDPRVSGVGLPEQLPPASGEAPKIVEAVSGARDDRVIASGNGDDGQVTYDERRLRRWICRIGQLESKPLWRRDPEHIDLFELGFFSRDIAIVLVRRTGRPVAGWI